VSKAWHLFEYIVCFVDESQFSGLLFFQTLKVYSRIRLGVIALCLPDHLA
jgi:hypothetical protein